MTLRCCGTSRRRRSPGEVVRRGESPEYVPCKNAVVFTSAQGDHYCRTHEPDDRAKKRIAAVMAKRAQ